MGTTYTPKPIFVRSDRYSELNGKGKSVPKLNLRGGSRAVVDALQSSCSRLGVGYIDLYQADFTPSKSALFYPGGKGKIVQGLKMCKTRGLCNSVGVVGVKGRRNVERIEKLFSKNDLKLDTLTADFSLVDRTVLYDGTLDACKKLGITFIASTPLGPMGIASGKFTARDPTGGEMGKPKFQFKELEPLLYLHDALKSVAGMVRRRLKERWEKEREKKKKKGQKIDVNEAFPTQVTPQQVALNYVSAKGATPVPSLINMKDIEDLIVAKSWRLNAEEMEVIDEAAAKVEG